MKAEHLMARLFVAVFAIAAMCQPVFASWPYDTAIGEVCFDIDGDNDLIGEKNDSWYSVAIAEINKSSMEWGGTYGGYHPASGTQVDVFKMTENATHVFMLLPVQHTITAGNDDRYCIYTEGADRSDIQGIAPFDLGFDTQADVDSLNKKNADKASVSWSGGIMTVTGTDEDNPFFLYSSAADSSYEDTGLIVKARYVSGPFLEGTYGGAWSGYTDDDYSGYGIGFRDGNFSYGFQHADNDIADLDMSWHIFRLDISRGSEAEAWVFDQNMSEEYNELDNGVDNENGYMRRASPAYVRNMTIAFDWGIAFAGQDSGSGHGYYTTDIEYDIQDEYITIVSPATGNTYSIDDSIIMRVRFLADFDNCSYYVNGDYWKNYTDLDTGMEKADVIDNSKLVVGANNVTVQCDDNSSHRYSFFARTGGDVDELFSDAFGFNASSICSSTITSELAGCIESYNLSEYQDFAAVVCYDINMSKDYSCLNVNNFTKNNYTIFYRPDSFTYDTDEDIPHIGAVFYYGTADIEGRIEIYGQDKFMYIPAQDKPKDCDIYFTSTSPTSRCSSGDGFIVNNHYVIVSDRNGNWYITGSAGYPSYTEQYANLSINTAVIPIIPSDDGDYLPGGVYTRQNCYQSGTDYIINIKNTQTKQFVVSVIGNSSSQYSLNSSLLTDNISTTGVEYITITDGDTTLCKYSNDATIFLPFSIPVLDIDGYDILIWIVMLLTLILSAMVPFALFIPLMLNDAYQLLNTSEMAILVIFAVMASLVNNSTSLERGVKHMIIMLGITVAFLTVMEPYDDQLGVDLSVYEGIMTDFADLASSTSIYDFVFNLFTFIIVLFTLLLTLPIHLMELTGALLMALSPALASAAGPFLNMLKVVFVVYLLIKAYEVITNKFKGA